MTCHLSAVTISLCVAATSLLAGCQRPMGSATGPYAPAGSLPPASSQPLIPFGSLNGATRVPPPPTGSSQVSSGYDGQPAAQFSAQAAPGIAASSFAANGSSSGGQRQSLGGMPVIDLTAGMIEAPAPVPGFAPEQAFASNTPAGHGPLSNLTPLSNAAPVGSGVATADWQSSTPSISVAPVDLAARLRPLDASQAAAIMPLHTTQDDVPADHPSVAMTQYRTESHPSPAWQSVQPASAELLVTNTPVANNAFEQRPSTHAYASQSPARSLPSTEPVEPQQQNAAATGNLLWRNPAVAR